MPLLEAGVAEVLAAAHRQSCFSYDFLADVTDVLWRDSGYKLVVIATRLWFAVKENIQHTLTLMKLDLS